MRSKIKVAGCAVQGRGHAQKNIVCQDKVKIYRFKDKCSAFVALADGAGSCDNSHIGAEYAVNKIGDVIHSEFMAIQKDPKIAKEIIISKLQIGLRSLASQNNVAYKSLSSTLLFVYFRRKRKITRFIAGHIGDGVIAFHNKRYSKVLSHPQKGEFASSTVFITSSKALNILRLYKGNFRGNGGFLLMSDGTADSLYRNRDGALAPGCELLLSLFDKLPQKKVGAIIQRNIKKVFRMGTLDDCSIGAIAVTGMEKVLKRKI